jgi:replicative DNA helicase
MSRQQEEQALPTAIDAEEAVLGALLLDPNVIAAVGGMLKPESFYGTPHQELYRAVLLVRDSGQPVSLTTVGACLEETGRLERVGGKGRLADLVDACFSSAGATAAARMVADRAMKRRVILDCQAIARQAQEPGAAVTDLLDRMQAKAAAISLEGPQRWLHHASSDLDAVLEDAEARRDGRAPEGIASGFYDLDAITQGFQRGDLVILAARPAMGKTALALNAAYNVARVGHPVVVVSLEMSGPQLMARVLSIDTSVSPGALRSGKTSDQDWVALQDGRLRLKDHPLWISDRGSATVGEVRTHCQQLAQAINRKLGLVVIDYLQLMDASAGRSSENRTQELSRITRALKGMARDLDVPVLALSQLSRAVEQRANKRPMLSDLRESGSIEQDADLVVFLYRDEYYNPDTADKGLAEVILGKHRNGSLGTVKLLFEPQFTRFRNTAHGGPSWAA